MQESYAEEKASKEHVKEELISLAGKVRFMEQTYRKESMLNEKVKGELQRFWVQREEPLSEMNSNSLECSPKFPSESSRMNKKRSVATNRSNIYDENE